MSETDSAGPALRIIRGDATPEEVAAIVAVLAAFSGADDAAPRRIRSAWSDPAVRLGASRAWSSRPR